MTEVCNCGGGHRTWLKYQLLCSRVPPAPVYKGGREEAGRPLLGVPEEGSSTRTPSPSRIPSRGKGEEGRKRRKGRKGGRRPLPLVQFRPKGGAQPAPVALPLFPLKPIKAH